MSIQLAGSNVIIAARQFNPTVFSQLWFVRNELLAEEDFGPGYLFSEAVVQMATPQFLMLVVPSQLQFSPNDQVEDQQALIQEKVGRIVERLPHTPYLAVGLNFVWHMRDERAGIEQLSRELFFKNDSELYRRFDAEDAKFGAYLSRNFGGCRQKLDIKPISLDESGLEEMQRLQFAFNFHRDLTNAEEPVRCIEEMLGRWNEARAESMRIVESLRRRA
jgi:hypothetical protein